MITELPIQKSQINLWCKYYLSQANPYFLQTSFSSWAWCSGPDHPAGKGCRQIIEQKVLIIFVGIQTFENYLQTQSCWNFALWLPSSPNKRPPIKFEGPLKKADMISLQPNTIVRVDFMHVDHPLAATCTIRGKIIGHPIKTVTSTASFFCCFWFVLFPWMTVRSGPPEDNTRICWVLIESAETQFKKTETQN